MTTQPQTYESIPALTGRPALPRPARPAPRRTASGRTAAELQQPPPLPEHARRDTIMVGVCMAAYIACLGFALNIIFGTLT